MTAAISMPERLALLALFRERQKFLSSRCFGHHWIALEELWNHTHELAVVGHDQKIQRSLDLNLGAVIGMDDGDALGVAVRRIWIRTAVLHQVGIGRIRGVEMRVAPIELRQ